MEKQPRIQSNNSEFLFSSVSPCLDSRRTKTRNKHQDVNRKSSGETLQFWLNKWRKGFLTFTESERNPKSSFFYYYLYFLFSHVSVPRQSCGSDRSNNDSGRDPQGPKTWRKKKIPLLLEELWSQT